jgi:hypothetical protein
LTASPSILFVPANSVSKHIAGSIRGAWTAGELAGASWRIILHRPSLVYKTSRHFLAIDFLQQRRPNLAYVVGRAVLRE